MVSIRHQENIMIVRTEAQRVAYRAQLTEALKQVNRAEDRKDDAVANMAIHIRTDGPAHTQAANEMFNAYAALGARHEELQALINNV